VTTRAVTDPVVSIDTLDDARIREFLQLGGDVVSQGEGQAAYGLNHRMHFRLEEGLVVKGGEAAQPTEQRRTVLSEISAVPRCPACVLAGLFSVRH